MNKKQHFETDNHVGRAEGKQTDEQLMEAVQVILDKRFGSPEDYQEYTEEVAEEISNMLSAKIQEAVKRERAKILKIASDFISPSAYNRIEQLLSHPDREGEGV